MTSTINHTNYSNRGYLYAMVSAVLFGASTPAAKYLLGAINPWLLAGLLYLGAGSGLFIILMVRFFFMKKASNEANLNVSDSVWLVCATVFGGILGPVLLMMGLVKTEAASASLLLNLESVFTAVAAWIIFREHTNKRLVFGMVLIVVGSIILTWHKQLNSSNFIGVLYICGACIAWAIDNNVTRKISAADPLKIVAVKSFVAGSVNVILAWVFSTTLFISWTSIAACSIVGFIGYGLSIVCFILGLRHIGTARTSAYFSLAPFVGAGLAIFFLGEHLSVQLIGAGILMGWGLWLHLSEHHAHEHYHEPLQHNHKHSHDEHHQHQHLTTDPNREPHAHLHTHEPLLHHHPHYPDIYHRHQH